MIDLDKHHGITLKEALDRASRPRKTLEMNKAAFKRLAAEVDSLQTRLEFYQERERDICKAVGGVSDGGQYRNDIIEHLQILFKALEAAKILGGVEQPGSSSGS